MSSSSLDTLSVAFGWIYFFAWSISFYPQVILNFQRKSVVGLSLEFQAYNVTGFTFYTIYSFANFFYQRHYNLTESVEYNDLAFALHALLITFVTVYQCFLYKLPKQRVHTAHLFLIILLWTIALYNIFLSSANLLPWVTSTDEKWPYNTVEYLGYGKAVISMIKYTPQAYLNFKRKSTSGWSIGNVLLDLTGGSFSFGQQFVDAYNKNDMSVLTGNIPKLLLAIESVLFDLLFIFQHYVLYRGNPEFIEEENDNYDDNHFGQGGNSNAIGIHRDEGFYAEVNGQGQGSGYQSLRRVEPVNRSNSPRQAAPIVNGGSLIVEDAHSRQLLGDE